MSYSLEEVNEAYSKLRSYVYHDNTDLYLRRQLVEFETGITKNPLFDTFGKKDFLYKEAKKSRSISYREKLEYITEKLNKHHEDGSFFRKLIDQIGVNYYPKKIISDKIDLNFITNKKSREPYRISRITPFIDAPIELHIISVLWIMRKGVRLDAELGDDCLGNRLILNKEKTDLIKGSGLFKPYFKQYQKWRDKSIDSAKTLLNDNRDVAFVNLDIKDYFNSVRLPKKEICDPKNKRLAERGFYNLEQIFLEIHDYYTEKLISNGIVEIDELDIFPEREHVILPIGLVSSYVLANYYLKSFDESINRHIKPSYYARYVDDLLFVIADPSHPDDLGADEFSNSSKISENLTTLEKFIIENFSPVLGIDIKKKSDEDEKRVIQLQGEKYEKLYCQSSKSLVYLFDAEESHLVIDKLKEELQERTSEFRDFPDEDESKGSFTDAAYHLQYEDSKDRVRTLKDYKEDRFGLTLFLANKIFSSLRQEEELSDNACDGILKFFKNKTAIDFYRLWEKILTLFLVNNKTKHYVKFYLQCITEIDQLHVVEELEDIKNDMQKSLAEYLDVANEITFSLNLAFYEKAFQEARDFEFKTEKWKADIFFSIEDYEPTRNDSYWLKRFRRSNMIRHHYIIHPLLNFTKGSKSTQIKNLVNPHVNFSLFELDEGLVKNSPRRVNFWECNMAQTFIELCDEIKIVNQDNKSQIFTINKRKTKLQPEEIQVEEIEVDERSDQQCLLTNTFNLFKEINGNHIPHYEFETGASASIENIFKVESITKTNSPEVWLNEIKVNTERKQSLFKIAFANTLVEEKNILSSIRGKANLNKDRIKRIGDVIRSARKENADILLFPEFFIPLDILSSIVDYAKKNEKLVVTGLEHVIIGKFAYNFVVTIIPIKIGGVKDAIVIPRLKNHYAHIEQHIIEGHHKVVPKPLTYRYDLIIWKNLYLSNYYCFELANIHHRGLWKNKADLIIGIEWNKDTPYYSNIVEATSRDLHCFFAQVNTSQFGDSRLTMPVQSALKDILRLKGGNNDSLLVAGFEINKLREFQRKTFGLTHGDKEFKPLPPDFDIDLVLRRINNESVLKG
jgi:Reverse transcriptase (RNA-dependent DNA polymerase)